LFHEGGSNLRAGWARISNGKSGRFYPRFSVPGWDKAVPGCAPLFIAPPPQGQAETRPTSEAGCRMNASAPVSLLLVCDLLSKIRIKGQADRKTQRQQWEESKLVLALSFKK